MTALGKYAIWGRVGAQGWFNVGCLRKFSSWVQRKAIILQLAEDRAIISFHRGLRIASLSSLEDMSF